LDEYESREITASELLERAKVLCQNAGQPGGGDEAVEAHMDNLILPLFGDDANGIALSNAQSRIELETEYRTFLNEHPRMMSKYTEIDKTPSIFQIRQKLSDAFQKVSTFIRRSKRPRLSALPLPKWFGRSNDDDSQDEEKGEGDQPAEEDSDLSLTVASPKITLDVPPVDQTSTSVVDRRTTREALMRTSNPFRPTRSSAAALLSAEKRLEMQRRKLDPLFSPASRGLEDVRMFVSTTLEGCEEGSDQVMLHVSRFAEAVRDAEAAVLDARRKGRPRPRYIPSAAAISDKDPFNSALCRAESTLRFAYQQLLQELEDLYAFSSPPPSSSAEKRDLDLERVAEFFFFMTEFGVGLSGNSEVSGAVKKVCEAVRRDAEKPFDPAVFSVPA